MPYCIKCGTELRPNAKFCHRCAAAVRTIKPTLVGIESKVYRHIKRHRGTLDVTKCAERLGVPEEEVEKAARALVAKGKLEKE